MKRLKIVIPILVVAAALSLIQGCGTTTKETSTTPASWAVVGTAGFTSGVASYNSLAFDGTTPYLACVNDSSASVYKFVSSWTAITGNNTLGSPTGDINTDIQFGSELWIAFSDQTAGSALRVKHWSVASANWQNQAIPTPYDTYRASYVYLAMNNNNPYVVYQDRDTGYPHLLQFDGTQWTELGNNNNMAFTSAGKAASLALVVSSNETPYVAFRGGSLDSQLYVRTKIAGAWSNVKDNGLTTANVADNSSISIALNPVTGKLWVVYQDYTDNSIQVKAADGTLTWTSKGVASSGAGKYPTIAFTADGTAYVAFQDVANGNKATVVKLVGSTWTPVVAAGFSSGTVTYTHLAIDSNNVPYIAFQDGANSSKATVMKYVAAQ